MKSSYQLLIGVFFLCVSWLSPPLRARTEPPIAPELARLENAIVHLRGVHGIRAEYEIKQWVLASVLNERKTPTRQTPRTPAATNGAPERFDAESRISFVAKGRKYRISRELKPSAVTTGMSVEVAFDGTRFQVLSRDRSVLEFSKKEQKDALVAVHMIPLLQPQQFLSTKVIGSSTTYVTWPDLFDDQLLAARLHNAKSELIKAASGKERVFLFTGGMRDAHAVTYRVYLDGPDGQPSRIEYVDVQGTVWEDDSFEYSRPSEENGWAVPKRMTAKCFDKAGRQITSTIAEATKIEFSPKLAEDAFTIDPLLANIVIDADSGRRINGDGGDGTNGQVFIRPPLQPRGGEPAASDEKTRADHPTGR